MGDAGIDGSFTLGASSTARPRTRLSLSPRATLLAPKARVFFLFLSLGHSHYDSALGHSWCTISRKSIRVFCIGVYPLTPVLA